MSGLQLKLTGQVGMNDHIISDKHIGSVGMFMWKCLKCIPLHMHGKQISIIIVPAN